MKTKLFTVLGCSLLIGSANAQHFDMTQWGADRGYTESTGAPYFRYEAEKNSSTGGSHEILQATDDQRYVQSEASNQQAVIIRDGSGYVEWTNDTGAADGVTLRFSVPFDQEAKVAITDQNNNVLGEITIKGDHSWQYCQKNKGRRDYKPEYYSIHSQRDGYFARMRFDEEHKLLSRDIQQGEKFRIKHVSGADVTVDFVEIEKARKVEYQNDWVRWNQTIDNNLQNFINNHQGQTIYIDQERVGIWGKLSLGSATLQGRGIFYTELEWEQNDVGFNGFSGAIRDLTLTGRYNQRYSSGESGYSSPGKCFNDGQTGRVERVLIEHFECGGWCGGSNGAYFSHCRFRNNYADGINLRNSNNCTVEYCNFRNNGDDDMASWNDSDGNSNIRFLYCTAEHNWRASSLAFFGGNNHRAANILIKDGLENGVRIVSDFTGAGWGGNGATYDNISIVHCGCIDGEVGVSGDFWGVDEASLHIEGSKCYDLNSQKLSNIDIYSPRGHAVFLGCRSNSINNLNIIGISVHGPILTDNYYAFYFENARGNGTIRDIELTEVPSDRVTNINNGKLESGSVSNGFNLQVENFVAEEAVVPAGCRLGLVGVSWEKSVSGDASETINPGDKLLIRAKVTNSSDVKFTSNYSLNVRLTINGKEIKFDKITELDGGKSYIVETTWEAEGGGTELIASLDPNGIFSSIVTGKNQIVKHFNVAAQPLTPISDLPFDASNDNVDFKVLDLRWNTTGSTTEFGKGDINVGDKVYFAAVVVNAGTSNSAGGTKCGVSFRKDKCEYNVADDNSFFWCDQNASYQDHASHQIKYYYVNGGKNQNNDDKPVAWKATQGDNKFWVEANEGDTHRDEPNRNNNGEFFTVTVPYKGTVAVYGDDQVDSPDNLNDSLSAISTLTDMPQSEDSRWYTINGQILSTEPTVPGIYIHNHRKIAIR